MIFFIFFEVQLTNNIVNCWKCTTWWFNVSYTLWKGSPDFYDVQKWTLNLSLFFFLPFVFQHTTWKVCVLAKGVESKAYSYPVHCFFPLYEVWGSLTRAQIGKKEREAQSSPQWQWRFYGVIFKPEPLLFKAVVAPWEVPCLSQLCVPLFNPRKDTPNSSILRKPLADPLNKQNAPV